MRSRPFQPGGPSWPPSWDIRIGRKFADMLVIQNQDPGESGMIDCDIRNTETPVGSAVEQLVPLLYADLRRMARRERWRVGGGQTLQTTALVSEAYLKLRRSRGWDSHQHFLHAAAVAMRQILVDHARAQLAAKRGGASIDLSLDDIGEAADNLCIESNEDLLAINDALEKLAELNPRLVQVVECRYFAGYSELETATALGITDRTVRRDWIKAKAWLQRELSTGI